MEESDVIIWVNSKLKKAEVNDMSEDFRDGTVLMELVVLLLPHNETAVLEAQLEKFNDAPTTMAHSLGNIRAFLTCLTADGTDTDVKPFDIFRGERDSIQQVLETLRNKYDNSNPDTSSTSTGQDIISKDMSKNTPRQDNINTDIADIQQGIRAMDLRSDVDHIGHADPGTTEPMISEQAPSEKPTSTKPMSEEPPSLEGTTSSGAPDVSRHSTEPITTVTLTENQDRIIIKIKDSDPLCVDKERLTKDSKFFKRHIDELHFYEYEMDDFEADTVRLFLTLLEDRQVGDIQDRQFKELHKMSVVFEVEWLRGECCKWLSSRMNKGMEDDEKLFVFEECLYILRKWETSDMMDDLIAKIVAIDNSSFITRYFQEFDKLDTIQLELMLKLGRSNSELFLQTVLQNLISKNELGENIKYLLQKMNLRLCCEVNNELYTTVLDTISNLTDISVADMRFVSQLTTETIRLVSLENEIRSNSSLGNRVLFDEKKLTTLREKCQTLKDISDAVSNDQVTSMFEVVELVLWVFYNNPPNSDEMGMFISTLADMCCNKRIQRVSHQYLDMIISPLEHSPLQQKEQFVQLLNMIKRKEDLSTNIQTVIITRDSLLGGKVSASQTTRDKEHPGKKRHCFVFKHPYDTNCDRSESKCGFVLKYHKQEGNWICELCVDDDYYRDTGIHYHDSTSARDMCTYGIFAGSIGPDKVVSVTVNTIWWKWWEKWLPHSECKITQRCTALDVSDYLIAK